MGEDDQRKVVPVPRSQRRCVRFATGASCIAKRSLQRSLCMGADPQRRTYRLEDPEALRALAHPLRGRLLVALRLDGPATASMLARRYDESSGATSYHLRVLARYGFVEDDPGHDGGRERWWRAAHDFTTWSPTSFLDSAPEEGEAARQFMRR